MTNKIDAEFDGWRKSSFSNAQDNCVEVGFAADGRVAVRDIKDRSRPPHIYTRAEWDAFLAGIAHGECSPTPPP
jgi:hypothetical protein